jgi:hypothetical protein
VKTDEIELILITDNVSVSFDGTVVRVKKGDTRTSVGFAVAFSGFRDLEKSSGHA